MERTGARKERRKSPRFLLDLPLEYRVTNAPFAHGGVVVNASEIGLLISSVKDMPIGTELHVSVLFPEGYKLTNFRVVAQVIWKDLHWEEDWEGYQYGLRFTQILEEDRNKLKQLLNRQTELDEIP